MNIFRHWSVMALGKINRGWNSRAICRDFSLDFLVHENMILRQRRIMKMNSRSAPYSRDTRRANFRVHSQEGRISFS